jgi:Leucine-rich repeat (LRR) protein
MLDSLLMDICHDRDRGVNIIDDNNVFPFSVGVSIRKTVSKNMLHHQQLSASSWSLLFFATTIIILVTSFSVNVAAQQKRQQQQQTAPCKRLTAPIKPCVCRDSSTLDCSAVQSGSELLQIKGLHNGQSIGFREIRINDNPNIYEIPDKAFGEHYAINVYSFSGNRHLSIIAPSVFSAKSAPTVNYIAVSSNSLTSFPFQVLRNYRKLEIFYGHDNKLETIPDRAFANIGNELSVIGLEDNEIKSIGQFPFTGLPALGHLSLAGNRLTGLGRNALHFTRRVNSVLFHNNFISSVSDFVFGSDGILPDDLVLANNQLTTMEQSKWQPVLENWNDAGYGKLSIHGQFCFCFFMLILYNLIIIHQLLFNLELHHLND